MSIIDRHLFHVTTIQLQEERAKSALERAFSYGDQNLSSAKANRIFRMICNDEYKKFGEKLHEEFPLEVYKNLISLTLTSREIFFCIDLIKSNDPA